MLPSKKSEYHFTLCLLATFIVAFNVSISSLFAQKTNAGSSLKTLTPNDYGQWERIGRSASFSNDGAWLKYQVSNQNEDRTTFLRNTKTGKTNEIKNSSNAIFSEDGKWLAYTKVLPGKELKKRRKSKSKVKNETIIINLYGEDTLSFKDVSNFRFSGKDSYVAIKREKEKVATLTIKNLDTGDEVAFSNVKEYVWKDKSSLLAMSIATKDSVGNGIQLFNPVTGALKLLDQKNVGYGSLQWREESDDLFVIRSAKEKGYVGSSYHLLLWQGVSNEKPALKIFDQTKYANFPDDTKILGSRIVISEDGNSIFFNTFNWEKEIKKEEKKDNKNKGSDKSKADTKDKKENEKDVSADDEAPDLEIWNSKDVLIIPAQKRSQMKDLAEPILGVWKVKTNTFVPLEDAVIEVTRIQKDNDIILGQDVTPYEFEAMFGRPNYDVHMINTNTGARKKVLTKINRYWNISPDNQYFVYLSNDALHLFDNTKAKSVNITKGLDDDFIDFGNDHPLPQKPAFGFGGWSTDSRSFFIYSEFDVWQVFTNGTGAKKITNGKKDRIRYRYITFDRDEEYIDMAKPVYFTMNGSWTKKTGLAMGVPGKEIKTLLYEDASISRFVKAKDADNLVYSVQSYEQSPNLFLTTTTFRTPKQVSNTNSFQKDFAWGKAVLVEFKNVHGEDAQGILYYPANYVRGKKYPMITYIYEKLSQGFHNYNPPSRTDYYNTTVWVQNGYFVLKPDIEFTAGDPGISSTKTLENAVKAVVDLGDVDAEKVGLIGHSWGGYQAGFVPTKTDIFAASVAGAGLTNLISMNLAVTPAFEGMPENDHFEVGQERMKVAPWKSPESYLRNSSVMNVEDLNTPILFEVGDNDTNVNWTQGIEYYNAARRAGKPFTLLVYAKEGHGLRNEKNRIDYQQRILKWFGHYLKGEKAEDWIVRGIPYAEQQRRLKNWKNRK